MLKYKVFTMYKGEIAKNHILEVNSDIPLNKGEKVHDPYNKTKYVIVSIEHIPDKMKDNALSHILIVNTES